MGSYDVALQAFDPSAPTMRKFLGALKQACAHGPVATQARNEAVRMDSAATSVLLGSGFGLAEQFVQVFEEADRVPLPDLPIVDKGILPINDGQYIFGKDSYKRYIVRGTGDTSDATGDEENVSKVGISSVSVELKSSMRGVDYEWTWISQVRADMINFDELGMKAAQARYELARYQEEFYLWGRPARGMNGLINNPNVQVVYNAANAAGSILFADSTATEIYDSINLFLRNMKADNVSIEAYQPDTLLVPSWLGTRMDQEFITVSGPTGSTVPMNLRDAIMKANPQIKAIVEHNRLDYRDRNGTSTAALTGDSKISYLVAVRNEASVIEMGRSLQYEELPMFQRTPNQYQVRAYTCVVEPHSRRPNAIRLLVV